MNKLGNILLIYTHTYRLLEYHTDYNFVLLLSLRANVGQEISVFVQINNFKLHSAPE